MSGHRMRASSTPEPTRPPTGPSGASRYAAELTMVRLTPGARPGDTTRVERVARTGLAREVLVERALPLLARARYLLDEIADPDKGAPAPVWARDRAEVVAGAIAALIGHSTTDSPPAPELEAVLAEGAPVRLTLEQLRDLPGEAVAQLPASALPLLVEPTDRDLPGRTLDEVRGWGGLTGEEYAHIRYGRPMSGDPLTRNEAEALAAETPADREARHEAINDALQDMGITVVPPCPMAPYAESSEPATRAYQPRLGPGDEAWQIGGRR